MKVKRPGRRWRRYENQGELIDIDTYYSLVSTSLFPHLAVASGALSIPVEFLKRQRIAELGL
ncbi:MAG: hypothetical protein LBR61_06415 [Synergistaceae bacterium]|jgi:hypothetical protein|nr:hypothetical protein [Synergistaceae bacterium]